MGRKSREKRLRREIASRAGSEAVADRDRRQAAILTGQVALEEGDGLVGGLSNRRPYALVRCDDRVDPSGRVLWRRIWLRPQPPLLHTAMKS